MRKNFKLGFMEVSILFQGNVIEPIQHLQHGLTLLLAPLIIISIFRWKKCLSLASGNLIGFGMAASYEYIKNKFDEETKERVSFNYNIFTSFLINYNLNDIAMLILFHKHQASEMVDDLKKSFKDRVSALKWMDKAVQAR